MTKSSTASVVSTPAVFVDETIIALANTVRHLRDAQKTLATQEAELRAELISVLGESRLAVDASGSVVFELVEAERRNTNLTLLETTFKEAYDATVSVTVYDKLNVPKQ